MIKSIKRREPNKLKLILPLPECSLNFVHHMLKYDREQSCADKSSVGSNQPFSKNHHNVCHLNPIIVTRQSAAKMKKKGGGMVNSASASVLAKKQKHKIT